MDIYILFRIGHSHRTTLIYVPSIHCMALQLFIARTKTRTIKHHPIIKLTAKRRSAKAFSTSSVTKVVR
jgi:hypothetical protein